LYGGEHFSEAFHCFKKASKLHTGGLTKFAALAWMGLIKDLLGEREKALTYYREALKYDSGESMGHGRLRIRIDRQWIEERLKTPFTWKK